MHIAALIQREIIEAARSTDYSLGIDYLAYTAMLLLVQSDRFLTANADKYRKWIPQDMEQTDQETETETVGEALGAALELLRARDRGDVPDKLQQVIQLLQEHATLVMRMPLKFARMEKKT